MPAVKAFARIWKCEDGIAITGLPGLNSANIVGVELFTIDVPFMMTSLRYNCHAVFLGIVYQLRV